MPSWAELSTPKRIDPETYEPAPTENARYGGEDDRMFAGETPNLSCKDCGARIVKPRRGRTPTYCRACYETHKRAFGYVRRCPMCPEGTTFVATTPDQVCCSRGHGWAWRRRKGERRNEEGDQ